MTRTINVGRSPQWKKLNKDPAAYGQDFKMRDDFIWVEWQGWAWKVFKKEFEDDR